MHTLAGGSARRHFLRHTTLGLTGVLTGYYGNPRQVWLSAAFNF